jgi:hypothetical protein
MSIREFINNCVEGGELFLLSPALESTPRVRHIFATKEVCDAVFGPWIDGKVEARFGRARAYLDTFMSGDLMSVRMPPSRSVHAQIALLEDDKDQVWEIRVRDPRPGIRIFGRFSEKDVFLALTIGLREKYKTEADWVPDIERCKKIWRTYFFTYKPLSGSQADDYISNSFSVGNT